MGYAVVLFPPNGKKGKKKNRKMMMRIMMIIHQNPPHWVCIRRHLLSRQKVPSSHDPGLVPLS